MHFEESTLYISLWLLTQRHRMTEHLHLSRVMNRCLDDEGTGSWQPHKLILCGNFQPFFSCCYPIKDNCPICSTLNSYPDSSNSLIFSLTYLECQLMKSNCKHNLQLILVAEDIWYLWPMIVFSNADWYCNWEFLK